MKSKSLVLCCLFLAILVWCLGCEPTCKVQAPAPDTWDEFGEVVLDAGHCHDTDYLVRRLSFSDITSGEWLVNTTVAANSDLTYIPPDHMPQSSELIEAYTEPVEMFLRSYEDIWDGELASVTISQPHDLKGIDSRSVVIWIKKGDKYYGVYIYQAVKTPWGIKVNSWRYQPFGSVVPWIDRANLVRDNLESCTYPEESFNFTTEWK